MFELIDNHARVEVPSSEYRRLLGYPADHPVAGQPAELESWARRWYSEHGKPWVYARQAAAVEIDPAHLRIEGESVASSFLRGQWAEAGVHTTMLVAVSAGRECEEEARRLWEAGKPDEYFFLEVYGSAVVEQLVMQAGGRVCAWAEGQGMAALPHYSPGYSQWEISGQHGLFELVRRPGNGKFPGDIQVLPSGMLQPKKSLLAVIGITRHVDRLQAFKNLVPCENCSLGSCQYRRADYRYPPPQAESAGSLQPARRPEGSAAGAPAPGPAFPYTVNPRALRKWSQERLVLKALADGSIEARFRYEGTTCSNLGQPLAFDYVLKLQRSAGGFRIVEADCRPAQGDAGHKSMCEYLKDSERLMNSIAAEKPMLGRSLDEAARWERASSPAGCYCDAASRGHKWGLVFEVIHYALGRAAPARAGASPSTPL